MRTFYTFWFVVCSGWGAALASLPPLYESAAGTALSFPMAIASVGLLSYLGLRRRGLPPEEARLNLDLRPWQQPIGVMQFILLTFLFSSLWGIGFVPILRSGSVLVPLRAFALALGGILGLWGACYAYRSRLGP
jgi:hypothetical protein